MPDIPVSSPYGFIGVVLVLFGIFLILTGIGIINIEKVSVAQGSRTWGGGIILIAAGAIFLIIEFMTSNPSSIATLTSTPIATTRSVISTLDITITPTNLSSPTFTPTFITTSTESPIQKPTNTEIPTAIPTIPTPELIVVEGANLERTRNFGDINISNNPKEFWRFISAPPAIYSNSIIADGILYFGSGNEDTNGKFYAINTSDGSVLWDVELTSAVYGGAAILGDKIFFGDQDGAFYAFNRKTGENIWQYGPFAGEILDGNPIIYKDQVYIGSNSSFLYAFNVNSGTVEWKKGYDNWDFRDASIFENILYTSTYSRMFALNLDTHQELWEVNIEQEDKHFEGPPIISEDIIFSSSHNNSEQEILILALERLTGVEIWRYTISNEASHFHMALADNLLIIGTDSGYVIGFNTSTKKEVWRAGEGKSWFMATDPSIVGNTIIFGSWDDGNVYALDVGTGEVLWNINSEGYFWHSNIVIYDGIIFVGNDTGIMLALK